MCFRHGNQRDVVRRAIAFLGEAGQFSINGLQAFRCGFFRGVFHLDGHINLSMQEAFNMNRRRRQVSLVPGAFAGQSIPRCFPMQGQAYFRSRSPGGF